MQLEIDFSPVAKPCDPPWKWVGSKRWFVARHLNLLPRPDEISGYREPFLGGGALFFGHFCVTRPAVLSDANLRLFGLYIVLRNSLPELLRELRAIDAGPYTRDGYECIRARLNANDGSPTQRAAWTLLVLRWGFNGLYRENKSGGINTPFGRTSSGTRPILATEGPLRAASAALRGARLLCGDWSDALTGLRRGELVVLDPPYVPVSKTADFVGYQAIGFGMAEQERLARGLVDIDRAGARFAVFNSDTKVTRELYRGWRIMPLIAPRKLSCKANKRRDAGEILVTNF